MRKLISAFVYFVFIHLSFMAHAAELPRLKGSGDLIFGGASTAKAVVDTIDLMGPGGSGSLYIGDFESGWNGWTSRDARQVTDVRWNVSNFNQTDFSNLAAWCGDLAILSCGVPDTDGGYGHNWNEHIIYRVSVAAPSLSALVRVEATLQIDTMPGYDYLYLNVKEEGQLMLTRIQEWDGLGVVAVDESFTILSSELLDGTDVYLDFNVISDGGWDNEDCLWPGSGACQLDDLTVTVSQTGFSDIVSFTDFQDGTFGDWEISFPVGPGDFAKLWTGLEDNSPCATNYSQQVGFIDDDMVVPGTGGSWCINWCYGPSGYIVNTTGGLVGSSEYINVVVNSPVMTWPDADLSGIVFSFDAYLHEDLDIDSPGMFLQWAVRSADTDGSSGPVQVLADQDFYDRGFLYFGPARYTRFSNDVSDLMNAGRDVVQVQVSVNELGWAFGWYGDDGYPAPYFDNVSVKVYDQFGPTIFAEESELAQDNFPETDVIDFQDLGSMHVRFDMARPAENSSLMSYVPGDSIVVDIISVRTGAVLLTPNLHYTIGANATFDAFRTTPTSGVVPGIPAANNGVVHATKWAFDLPDTGCLFPGDILRYYIRAGDEVAGDVQYVTLPSDLSELGAPFDDHLAYSPSFTVHALPTINAPPGILLRPVLVWTDSGPGKSREAIHAALTASPLNPLLVDVFYTNAPSRKLGNGLSGRTAGGSISYYTDILYSSGTLDEATLSGGAGSGDYDDDITLLKDWLSLGGNDLLLTGDNLVSNLAHSAEGFGFLTDVMGLELVDNDVRIFINNQVAPLVLTNTGQDGMPYMQSWVTDNGCHGGELLRQVDAVNAIVGTTRLAEFADQNGMGGAYEYAAASEKSQGQGSRVLSMPYSYDAVEQEIYEPLFPLTSLLESVLWRFELLDIVGAVGPGEIPVAYFGVDNYPNPFNPSTEISYTIKAPGHLVLKIYNLRGELVKTLIDGEVDKGDAVRWNGENDQGGQVSSGVYFYEAKMGADVLVKKMALIK